MANAVRRDIEYIFGIDNVRLWADMDKSNDQNLVDNRITDALENALTYIYGRLRRRYAIPFAAMPKLVKWLNALYAGILLYDARMLVSTPGVDQVGKARKEFRRILREILSGQLHLAEDLSGDEIALLGIDIPFVGVAVGISTDGCNTCDSCHHYPCCCTNFFGNN